MFPWAVLLLCSWNVQRGKKKQKEFPDQRRWEGDLTCRESLEWQLGCPALPYPWPWAVSSRPVRSTAARQFLLFCKWGGRREKKLDMMYNCNIAAITEQEKNTWIWGENVFRCILNDVLVKHLDTPSHASLWHAIFTTFYSADQEDIKQWAR